MMTKLSRLLFLAVVALVVTVSLPMTTQAATCTSSQTVSVSSSATSLSVCAGQKVTIKVGTTTANFSVSSVSTQALSITTSGSPTRATISVGSSLNVLYPQKFDARISVTSVRNGTAVVSLSATHIVKPSATTPIVDLKPDLVVTNITLNQAYPYDGGVYAGNLLKITYKNNGSETIVNPFAVSLKFGPSWVWPQLFQPIPYYLDTYNNGSSAFLSSVDKGNNTYEVSPNRNTTSGLNAYALAPGQSGEMYVFFQQYYGQLLANGLTITVTADSASQVSEVSEANNVASTFYPTTKGYDGSGNYVYMSSVKMIPGTNKVQ